MMLGKHPDPAVVKALREFYRLDDPLFVQWGNWWRNLFHGNLGISYVTRTPVIQLLANAIEPTLVITVLCVLFSGIVGIAGGIISAVRRNSWIDYLVTVTTFLGISMPSFFLGIFLIWIFSICLNLLPPTGYVSPFQNIGSSALHLLMPVFAQGSQSSCGVVRIVRSATLEVLQADFTTTARAKGLRETAVLLKHVLRNALIPVITVLGLQLAGMMGGIIIIESVFGIPGMGRLLLNAIYRRDYPLLQAAILGITMIFLFTNLVVDILYVIVDPRIRYS